MTEQVGAADQRARKQRWLPVLVMPILFLFLVSPCFFSRFYSTAVLDAELTGFWTKLPLLRMLMLAHPETELLWWMDSDVVLTDMLFEPPWDKYASHNLVLPGWDDRVYNEKSWMSINAGSFIIRNCQWSLDLIEAWGRMGVRGPVRYEYGKVFAETLSDRKPYEADDQSALVYMLVTQRERWGVKTFLESSYCLHGYWVDIVEKYEAMRSQPRRDGQWPPSHLVSTVTFTVLWDEF